MSQVFPFAKLARLPEPVLSVYLDVNPVRHVNRNSDHGYLVWFRGQARQLLANRENSERSALSALVERVEHFLEETPQEHRGLAIFAGPGVWEVVPLAVEPQNELHWGRPVLWPLTAMGAQHPSSCIAVVDQSGVRLFSLRAGELSPLQTLEFRIDPSQWKEMRASHSAERGAGLPHGRPTQRKEERACRTVRSGISTNTAARASIFASSAKRRPVSLPPLKATV